MSEIYKTAAGAGEIDARYGEALERWPVPNEQRRVATRHGDTFVVACGPTGAPALLLLQGSGANAAMWLNDVAVWAEHFRVYAVDVPGEPGRSTATRLPLDSDAHATWLDDVLDALSLQEVRLVGVSLGGWIALDYAIRRPDRVSGLVVLCPGGIGRQRMSFLFKALPMIALGRRGRARLMRMLIGRVPVRPTSFDGHIAALASVISRHFRRRRERLPIFGDAALRSLGMPVMLVVGGRDPMLNSYESMQRLQRCAPDVTVRFLADAGHILRGQAGSIQRFLMALSSNARQSSSLRRPEPISR